MRKNTVEERAHEYANKQHNERLDAIDAHLQILEARRNRIVAQVSDAKTNTRKFEERLQEAGVEAQLRGRGESAAHGTRAPPASARGEDGASAGRGKVGEHVSRHKHCIMGCGPARGFRMDL